MNRSKRGHASGSSSISSVFVFLGGLAMNTYKVRKTLPTAHSTQIGRIITRWALLEWRLRNIAYRLLNIGPKEGRLAVRDPRATDYVLMLEDLMNLKGLKIPFNFVEYRKLLEILGTHRDLLAHGIWIKHPDFKEPVIQMTKGKWSPDPTKPGEKAKRLIKPEGALIRLKDLREFPPLIDRAIKGAEILEHHVSVALDSSRGKSRPQPRPSQ